MVQRGGGLSGESGGRRGVGSAAAVAGCLRRTQIAGVHVRCGANERITEQKMASEFQIFFSEPLDPSHREDVWGHTGGRKEKQVKYADSYDIAVTFIINSHCFIVMLINQD